MKFIITSELKYLRKINPFPGFCLHLVPRLNYRMWEFHWPAGCPSPVACGSPGSSPFSGSISLQLGTATFTGQALSTRHRFLFAVLFSPWSVLYCSAPSLCFLTKWDRPLYGVAHPEGSPKWCCWCLDSESMCLPFPYYFWLPNRIMSVCWERSEEAGPGEGKAD